MSKLTLSLSLALLLVLLALPAGAAPPFDAGEFPTLTPTITLTPTVTLTPLPETIIVTLNPGYPVPTQVIEGLDPGDPSNIQQEDLEATQRAQQAAAEESSGGNPLITAAYIGLFIILVVGVWMLFSRRGIGGP